MDHNKESPIPNRCHAGIFFFSKLGTAVYPSNMAPFSLKLWGKAFQTIPNIPFFDVLTKKIETLNSSLPLKHSSDRPQTLPKRVSDYPQHFIFRRQEKKIIGFFRSRNSFSLVFVKIWGSYELTDVTIKFLSIVCFRCTCDHLCTTPKRSQNGPQPKRD